MKNLLTLEDEKFKTITTEGGLVFKIRYISPIDRVKITQRRVALQNGNSVEAFTQDDYFYFENIAINDTCIEEYPEPLKSNESCQKWPDVSLISEVAVEIRKHTNDLDEKLKKNKPIA